MLEVGNGAMTDAEYVAHFSICKSPPHILKPILLNQKQGPQQRVP
jgi:hypothetical protein